MSGKDDKKEETKANITSWWLWGRTVGVGISSSAVIIAAAMQQNAASAPADTQAKRLGGPLHLLPKKAGNISFLQAVPSARPVMSSAQQAADWRRKTTLLIREISLALPSALPHSLMFRKSTPSGAFFHPQREDNTSRQRNPDGPDIPIHLYVFNSIAGEMPPQPPVPPPRPYCGGLCSRRFCPNFSNTDRKTVFDTSV